ncbi:MAG: GNAT family N-acetyltransferase [Saprospirales bacterium]|nr:GNAT family N-acetyltransferase [Saprospirales bacterium]MBK8921756.1 GNAT family N-acetyltransferase [Saprospirales bacterium]
MLDRDAYRRFCATAPDLPVFLQDWYLDAVCAGGQWSAALVRKGPAVVGVLPYFLKQKLHWRYVAMPPLCKMMGPYLLPDYRTPRREVPLLNALLDQLPPLAAFEQDFNYTAANWLPFYWRGFRQTTRYSYVLPLNDLKTLRDNLAPDYRNNKLPKAAARVKVHTGNDLELFYRVHNRSFERQGLPAPIPFEFLQRLDAALARRHAREIFWATDHKTGAVHAVAYLIWDKRTAYYLLAGDEPALRQSGAGILLAWEAIRYAKETLNCSNFDFAGSMIKSIERVRRQFGAEQRTYLRVQKEWSVLWKWGKRIWR